jgi:post-segregation antitoxin (ccd killing protein)
MAQEKAMASQAEQYDPYAIPTRRMTRDDLLRAADYWDVDAAGLDLEGLRVRVKQVAEARWRDENRVAIDEFNGWVLEHGIPHADMRRI